MKNSRSGVAFALSVFFAGASVSLLIPAGAVALDQAQAQAAPGESGFDEIVVTARKREEVVQSVPISITAFSQEMLENKGIETISDLRFASPSLYISTDTFRQDTVNIAIRGLRNFGADGIQYDTAAAVYVDGVSYARTQGLTGSLYDVENVEVLKGPQGTLVGRNSTGGAVLYTTKEPQNTFGGFFNFTGGNYDNTEATGAVNVPISDKLAVRLAGNYAHRQGYLENLYFNPVTGARNDTAGFGYRKAGGRLEVKITPTDDLKILLKAETSEEHDTGSSYHSIGYFTGTVAATGARPSICNIPGTCTTSTAAAGVGFTDVYGNAIAPYFVGGVPGAAINTSPAAYNTLLASLARQSKAGFWTMDQYQNYPTAGHFSVLSGSITQTFDNIDIKLLGADRWYDTSNSGCSRGDPYCATQFYSVLPLYQSWNSELTVNGSQFDDTLKWTTGLFFFTESQHSQACYFGSLNGVEQLCTGTFSPNFPVPSTVSGHQVSSTVPTSTSSAKNSSYAYYLQGTYTILPDLNFTAGARYTLDQRELASNTLSTRFPATAATTATTKNALFLPGPVTVDGFTYQGQTITCGNTDSTGSPLPVAQCASDISHNFHKLTWTLDLDYNLFDKTLVYATTRKGYRAGVINGAKSDPSLDVALPEDVQDYEIGVKSDWEVFDIPVRTNADVYDTQYHDIQTVVALPNVSLATVPGPGGTTLPCTQASFNGGQCSGTTTDNITVNAKAARIYGAEWDFQMRPIPELSLAFGGSYLHAQFTNFTYSVPAGYLQPAAGISGLNGTPFPLPQLQVTASATYTLPGEDIGLPVEEVSFSGDLYNQSHFLGSQVGFNAQQTDPAGYTFINFRLNVRNIMNTDTSLSAFVTNAFNRAACQPESGSVAGAGAGVYSSVPIATFGTANTSGVTQCIPLPPRMFGATLKYTF